MAFVESSITLDFPDTNHFRLSECDGYKSLQNIREMDFCWYNEDRDILYLIELKDWGNDGIDEESDPSFSEEEIEEKKKGITKYRVRNLVEKSIGTLSMFSSILLDRSAGRRINDCAPFEITTDTQIILLNVINWNIEDYSYVANINTEYRTKLNSFAKLFGVRKYNVLTKNMASGIFDWVR